MHPILHNKFFQLFPGKCHFFIDLLFGDRKVNSAVLALGMIMIIYEMVWSLKSQHRF